MESGIGVQVLHKHFVIVVLLKQRGGLQDGLRYLEGDPPWSAWDPKRKCCLNLGGSAVFYRASGLLIQMSKIPWGSCSLRWCGPTSHEGRLLPLPFFCPVLRAVGLMASRTGRLSQAVAIASVSHCWGGGRKRLLARLTIPPGGLITGSLWTVAGGAGEGRAELSGVSGPALVSLRCPFSPVGSGVGQGILLACL